MDNNQQQFEQQFDQQFQPPMPNAPVQSRNLALYIILTIVTCGIFGLYWLYCLNEDLKTLTGDTQSMGGGVVILLSIVTCGIYGWVWMYKQGEKIDGLKSSRGNPSSNSGILYLILALFGLTIVSYALMQNEINTLVEQN